jgi:hypothetical protein
MKRRCTKDANLMCIGPCIILIDEEENQLDVTQYFIEPVIDVGMGLQ